ncbi:hypothetical protein ASE23_24125 [Rhizobium sp. Root73]|uniref:DUF6894 family protein n=1 Tax=unclassified Rhizobium TaxID=2613769 RepID=UPI0007262FF2|nr:MULTISPECIES: hypothetical protein [unclassified Rhizobium]KQX98733.1 hypothetical protein ASD36_21745 [Rhizobium sp. Root1334]KRC10641.1 hypothetical protein ASE23_24125 [Rhizobium sp. Root73]
MVQFYFNLRDGEYIEKDTIGIELPDLDTAIQQGRLAVHDLMQEQIATGLPIGDEAFEVCDRYGKVLFSLPFKELANS